MSIHFIYNDAKLHYVRRLAVILLALVVGAPLAGAATINLKDGRHFQGTIDEGASDDQTIVIRIATSQDKNATAVIRIARAKIDSINTQEVAGGGGGATGQVEEEALKKAESELAANPANDSLRKKVDDLREVIRKRERQAYAGLFEKIEKLIGDKKFEEAIAEADAMLARITKEGARKQCNQLKAQAHIGLARQFGEFVNIPDEEKNYNEAMKADPDNPVPPLEMAEILKTSPSRKADRIANYEKGIVLAEKFPGSIDAKKVLDIEYKLGELYLDDKRFVQAGDMFLKVLMNDKDMLHAKTDDLALTAYGRIPVAGMDAAVRAHIIASVGALLKIKPINHQAHLLLGHIYFDQKNWTAARDNFLLAVKTTEGPASNIVLQDALFALGLCLHKLHQDQDAVSAFDKLLVIKPDHYDGLCELADILIDNDNPADAGRFYDQALAVDADKSRAYLGKGDALENQGKFEDARKSFGEVLARNDKNASAQLAIARSYYREKRFDETILEAEKAKDLIRAHYKLGAENAATSATAAGTVVAATPTATPSPTPSPSPTAVAKATSATLTAAKATSATAVAAVVAGAAPPASTAPAGTTAMGKDDAELLTKITTEDRLLMAEANTLIGKANIYAQPPKTNLARDFFTVALKFSETYAQAHEGFGLSYAADKLNGQAEESFQKAITLDPTDANFVLSYAIYWHKDRNSAEKALPLYMKYQELGGREPAVSARIKECGGTPKN